MKGILAIVLACSTIAGFAAKPTPVLNATYYLNPA
jgi:hypothetical protein